MARAKQRRIEMFAALDTCPLHYGLKTNLVRTFINEFNLTVELPIRRNFSVDLGLGVLYSNPKANEYNFAYFFSDLTRMRGRNLCYFDHSYLIRKGFTFEVIPKFFLSEKKQLYLGPQLCVRYYYYKDKWIDQFKKCVTVFLCLPCAHTGYLNELIHFYRILDGHILE